MVTLSVQNTAPSIKTNCIFLMSLLLLQVTSRPGGAILSVPSGLAYPIQIPAGVTLQTASGKANSTTLNTVNGVGG